MFKPILFNSEMVKAILDGRKTQTRRLVRPQPVFQEGEHGIPVRCDDESFVLQIMPYECIYEQGRIPPCLSGDILWVRETWCPCASIDSYLDDKKLFAYRADYGEHCSVSNGWKPSIHMPKEAARIFLRVKNVRLERLQSITDRDAELEGVSCFYPGTNMVVPETMNFVKVWDNTIKPADRERFGWAANPWVWVIEFERCEKPEGWCKK